MPQEVLTLVIEDLGADAAIRKLRTLREEGAQLLTLWQQLKGAGKGVLAPVTSETQQVSQELKKATTVGNIFRNALRNIAIAGATGFRGLLNGIRSVVRGITTMLRALTSVHTLILTVGTGLAVRGVINYADAWLRARNRLSAFLETGQEVDYFMDQLFSSAQRARVPLESLVNLSARLLINRKDIGLSLDETLRFTEIVAKTVTLSGSTEQESQGALRQLSQILAKEQIRTIGQEIQAVREQTPFLFEVILQGLQKSEAEFRVLAETGKLTSREIIDAVLKMGDVVEIKFSKIIPTIGEAFVVLNNSMERFVGLVSKSTGAGEAFSGFILDIAKDINGLASVLTNLGRVVAPGSIVDDFLSGKTINVGKSIEEAADKYEPRFKTFTTLIREAEEAARNTEDALSRAINITPSRQLLAFGEVGGVEDLKQVGKDFAGVVNAELLTGLRAIAVEGEVTVRDIVLTVGKTLLKNIGGSILRIMENAASLLVSGLILGIVRGYSVLEELFYDMGQAIAKGFSSGFAESPLVKFVQDVGPVLAAIAGQPLPMILDSVASFKDSSADNIVGDNEAKIESLIAALRHVRDISLGNIKDEFVSIGEEIEYVRNLLAALQASLSEPTPRETPLLGDDFSKQFHEFFDGIKAGFKSVEDEIVNLEKLGYRLGATLAKSIGGEGARALFNFASGAKSAGEAFTDFAVSVLQQISELILEFVILYIVQSLVGFASGGASDSGLTGLLTSLVGTSTKAATSNAEGGVVNRRTTLFLGSGGRATMSEEGEEAILPLERDGTGRMGVRSNGGGNGGVVVLPVMVKDNSEIDRLVSSDKFKRSVLSLMKSNQNEFRAAQGR